MFRDEFRHILLDVHAARSAMQRLMPWFRLRPRHFAPEFPGVLEPRTGLSMGQHCERMAREWQIAREEQDTELRKQAIFWIGQSEADGAEEFLLEIINK